MLVAFMLVFVLALSGASAAFATGLNSDGAAVSANQTSLQAAITKILQVPAGTTVPTADFQFTATPLTVDGEAYASGNMPALSPVALSISYPGPTGVPSGNTTNYTQESTDLFANVTFPHAGIYVYSIEETKNTYASTNPAITETMTYSNAEYQLTVYVAYNETGDTYVYALGDKVITADNSDQETGDKLDPTLGGDGENYTTSQMTFTNTYVKTNSSDQPENPNYPGTPDPTNPANTTLSVSKNVAGNFASRDFFFNYSMTVNAPTVIYDPSDASATAPVYHAYIMEGNTVVNATPITFTSGDPTPVTFQLKAGQHLAFVDTPVGTTYTVTEAAAANYIATASVTTAGAKVDVVDPNNDGGANEALTTGVQLVGDAANSADYLNTYNIVSPTGVIMNNLPLIGMVVLAAAALAAFIVTKARKHRNAGVQA